SLAMPHGWWLRSTAQRTRRPCDGTHFGTSFWGASAFVCSDSLQTTFYKGSTTYWQRSSGSAPASVEHPPLSLPDFVDRLHRGRVCPLPRLRRVLPRLRGGESAPLPRLRRVLPRLRGRVCPPPPAARGRVCPPPPASPRYSGGEPQPPIWDMLLAGLTNPSWLIRWPSSFSQTAPSITRARWSSEAPPRIRSRSGVSWSENRHVRSPPSAVSRTRLQVVQKACETEEMKPTPPGAPSANWKLVEGPGRSAALGLKGNRSSICSWMRRLGTTSSFDQMW